MSYFLLLTLVLTATDGDEPQECLRRYHARKSNIENAVVVSEWQDFFHGKPERRDYQTRISDSLGRWRLKMVSEQPGPDGDWVRHKETPYEWDIVFDGKIGANMTFDPRKDRVGNDLEPGEKGGYRVAQIHGADWQGMKNQRTPLKFADPELARLQEAVDNKQPIQVNRKPGGQIEFRFPAQKSDELWHILVDTERDWVPVETGRETSAGKPLAFDKYQYARTQSGVDYIKDGLSQYFGPSSQDGQPMSETHFQVTECTINDPDFSDDSFAITFTEDQVIQDMRYDAVLYRIGGEEVATEQLAALAKAALKEKNSELGTGVQRSSVSWIVWMNVAIIVVVALLFIFNRKRSAQ